MKTLTIITLLFAGQAYAGESKTSKMEKSDSKIEFKTLDADRDGFISKSEADVTALVRDSFQKLDADQDGRLSRSELSQLDVAAQKKPAAKM